MVQAYLQIESGSNFNSTTGLLSSGSAVLLFDSQDMFNSSSEFQISIAGKWTHAEQNNLRIFTLENKNDSTAGYLCLTHSESRSSSQFGYVRYDNGNANTATIIKDDSTDLVDVDRHFSVKFKQESNIVRVQGYNVSENGSLSALGGSTSVYGTGNPKLNKIAITASANFKPNLYSIQILSGLGDFAGHYIAKEARTFAGTRIQLRHDTAANFTSVNPVLTEGEMAYETDTKKFKIGDGTTAYTSLDYQAHVVYLTRAEYNALEVKDATTLYIITDEEGGGGSGVTYTAEAPLSISADNVISIDTTDLGGTTLRKDGILIDYALDLTANGTVGGSSKAARAESNESGHDAYKAFSGHSASDTTSKLWGPNRRKTDSWVELYVPEGIIPASAAWTYGSTGEILPAVELLASNNGQNYTSLGSVEGISTVTGSMTFNANDSYKYLRFKFRDACLTSNWGKFGLTSLIVKSSGMTTYTELLIGDNIDVTNGTMNVNLDGIGSELSDLSTRVTMVEGNPVLGIPVNNCVLAMPTVPTFDGTNVTIYAGTKIAIPNGRESGSNIPKANIVTLSANATINQSTFNGGVTLMLKSDGTIDQTAYPYNIVDDINKVTPTAYNWYYCRYSNRHYLASSTGTLTPYQRFKIGEYNLAEAATNKYFKVRFPIGFPPDNEFIDVTPAN